MLQRIDGEHQRSAYAPADASQQSEFISLREIAAFLRRSFLTIGAAIVLTTAAGTYHVLTAVPQFSARAQIVIDPEKSLTLRQQMGEIGVPLDNAQVESQIEFLRSERIAAAVLERLGLASDPEFGGGEGPKAPSLYSRIHDLLIEPKPAPPVEQRGVALSIFASKLNVRRIGQSYLIEVLFTSTDPDKAARISNATAEAYIADRVGAKSQAEVRSSMWLEARI